MMKRLEHLGIAVGNLDEATQLFETLLGTPCYKVEEVDSEHVKTAFFKVGESKIELLQATHPDSAIAKYLDKKGQGIHHVAFEVEDIHQAMQDMSERGFRLLNESPKRGADNKLICFLHPKSANGVLVELCQSIEVE